MNNSAKIAFSANAIDFLIRHDVSKNQCSDDAIKNIFDYHHFLQEVFSVKLENYIDLQKPESQYFMKRMLEKIEPERVISLEESGLLSLYQEQQMKMLDWSIEFAMNNVSDPAFFANTVERSLQLQTKFLRFGDNDLTHNDSHFENAASVTKTIIGLSNMIAHKDKNFCKENLLLMDSLLANEYENSTQGKAFIEKVLLHDLHPVSRTELEEVTAFFHDKFSKYFGEDFSNFNLGIGDSSFADRRKSLFSQMIDKNPKNYWEIDVNFLLQKTEKMVNMEKKLMKDFSVEPFHANQFFDDIYKANETLKQETWCQDFLMSFERRVSLRVSAALESAISNAEPIGPSLYAPVDEPFPDQVILQRALTNFQLQEKIIDSFGLDDFGNELHLLDSSVLNTVGSYLSDIVSRQDRQLFNFYGVSPSISFAPGRSLLSSWVGMALDGRFPKENREKVMEAQKAEGAEKKILERICHLIRELPPVSYAEENCVMPKEEMRRAELRSQLTPMVNQSVIAIAMQEELARINYIGCDDPKPSMSRAASVYLSAAEDDGDFVRSISRKLEKECNSISVDGGSSLGF